MRTTLLLVLAGIVPLTLQAQDTGQAVLRQIAGQHLYLDLAAPVPLTPGDTLVLADGADPAHRLVVVAGDSARVVVTFAGPAFPLTRGTTVNYTVRRGAGPPPMDAGGAVGAAAATTAPGPRPAARQPVLLSGRLLLRVDGRHTRTTGIGSDPEVIDRDFATPVASLRLRASRLPGGLEFDVNLSASHRYATGDLVQPETLVRIYQFSLAKSFTTLPLALRLGRFYNPYEYFSGYWDGAMLYLGGERLGGGALAGYEPNLANDGFQSTYPKATVFLQARGRSRQAGYRTDLSFNTVFAQDTTPAHTFLGWALDTYVGRTTFSTSLQLDRNPDTDGVTVTRLLANLAVPVGSGWSLRARASRRQPYQLGPATNMLPFRRDRLAGGVGFNGRRFGVTADVGWNQQEGLADILSYGAGLYAPRVMANVGASLSGSYWDGGSAGETGLALTGRLTRPFGTLNAGLGYQYYQSELAGRRDVSHVFDVSATLRLSRSMRATFRAATRQGAHLTSGDLGASLWWAF